MCPLYTSILDKESHFLFATIKGYTNLRKNNENNILSSCLSFSMEVLQVYDLVRMKLDISSKTFCASNLYQSIVFFEEICNCKCKWNSMRILLVTIYLVYIYAHFNTVAVRFYRFFTFLSSWNQFSNYILVINFRSDFSEKKNKSSFWMQEWIFKWFGFENIFYRIF